MPAKRITFANKTQAAAYSSAKFNAADANDLKDAANDHALAIDQLAAALGTDVLSRLRSYYDDATIADVAAAILRGASLHAALQLDWEARQPDLVRRRATKALLLAIDPQTIGPGSIGRVYADATTENNGAYYVLADGRTWAKSDQQAVEATKYYDPAEALNEASGYRTYDTPNGYSGGRRIFQRTNTGAATVPATAPLSATNVLQAGWREISEAVASGSGGAVSSVNAKTGAVVLGANDIDFTAAVPGFWASATVKIKAALDWLQAKLLPKLAATPAYNSVLAIDFGRAQAGTCGVIQANGDITSLTVILDDGCWSMVPVKNITGATITVTVPASVNPFLDGTLRYFQLPAGKEKNVIFHRNGTQYKCSFV